MNRIAAGLLAVLLVAGCSSTEPSEPSGPTTTEVRPAPSTTSDSTASPSSAAIPSTSTPQDGSGLGDAVSGEVEVPAADGVAGTVRVDAGRDGTCTIQPALYQEWSVDLGCVAVRITALTTPDGIPYSGTILGSQDDKVDLGDVLVEVHLFTDAGDYEGCFGDSVCLSSFDDSDNRTRPAVGVLREADTIVYRAEAALRATDDLSSLFMYVVALRIGDGGLIASSQPIGVVTLDGHPAPDLASVTAAFENQCRGRDGSECFAP